MKKLFILTKLCLLINFCFAQGGGGGGGGTGSQYWASDGTNLWNTNTGNVGIGTATPATALDVKGANGELQVLGSLGAFIGFSALGNSGLIGLTISDPAYGTILAGYDGSNSIAWQFDTARKGNVTLNYHTYSFPYTGTGAVGQVLGISSITSSDTVLSWAYPFPGVVDSVAAVGGSINLVAGQLNVIKGGGTSATIAFPAIQNGTLLVKFQNTVGTLSKSGTNTGEVVLPLAVVAGVCYPYTCINGNWY